MNFIDAVSFYNSLKEPLTASNYWQKVDEKGSSLHNELMIMNTEKELLDDIVSKVGVEQYTPGLERTQEFFLPFVHFFQTQLKIPVVIIAGTNGKGETAHSLNFLLLNSGWETFLWTSPHIQSYTERFRILGQDLQISELINVHLMVNQLLKEKISQLTFYEYSFFLFLQTIKKRCEEFPSQKKKVLILEVGLGGKFDTVNHFHSDLVLLSSISRDHVEILGNRYDQILAEKCGVFRAKSFVMSALELDYLKERVVAHKVECGIPKERGADLFDIGVLGKHHSYSERNQALAFSGYLYLNQEVTDISKNLVQKLLHETKFPAFKGRSEVFKKNQCQIIFVGAHNVDGMRKLAQKYCHNSSIQKKILCAFSKRTEEEIQSMLKILFSMTVCNESHQGPKMSLHLTAFSGHFKALDGASLKKILEKSPLEKKITWEESWMNFLENQVNSYDGEILVCGSYYFIGEVQNYLSQL